MKKLLLVISAVFTLSIAANAQEIGLRFGSMSGNYAAIDAVFSFEKTRVHADVSFGQGIGAAALFDFLYGKIGDSPFNYYAGLGAAAWVGTPLYLGAAAEVGIEYRFKELPIVIGADYRPHFGILGTTGLGFNNGGLNIRWVF